MESPRPLSRPRRRPARDLARRIGLRTALTAILLAALPVASAHAAGGSAVVIAGPEGTTFAMSEEMLRAGTEGGTYTVRARPGEAGEAFTRTGVSVRQLILLAGADPEAIGFVAVPRPDGTSAYLPGADFGTAPPFEAALPALVSADSGCVRFLRPLTADPNEVNGEDNIASCGAPLTIEVRDGNVLSVRASASSTRTKAGTAVRFSAAAEGAKEGEGVTFEWSFGDSQSAAGQTASHTFTAAGSYRVTVAATGSDESGGESAPLTIVVGAPAAVGTGAGKDATREPKRAATLSEAKAESVKVEPEESEAGADSDVGPVGPVVGPLPSRTAGRFVQGSDDRVQGAPQGQAESGTGAEGGEAAAAKQEGTGAVAVGRTVRGRLVADFVLPGAAGTEGASSATAAGSGSAAAPASGPVSVPLTGLIAGALLLGGAALQWRRQSRGALR
jgi:PKD repeat protein